MAAGISIRRATVADAATLAKCRYAFRARSNVATQGQIESQAAFVARATVAIERHLVSGVWHAWIAEHESRVIGHVFLQIIEKLPNPSAGEPELLGYLTSFFVDAALRDQGVGSALLDELERQAAALGVEKILIVGTTERSRPLYARRGFRQTPDLLQKRVAARAAKGGAVAVAHDV